MASLVPEKHKQQVLNYLFLKRELINFSNDLLKLIIEQTKKAQNKLIIEETNLNFMIIAFQKTSLIHQDILEAAISDKHNDEKGLKFELDEISICLSKIYESESNEHEIKDDDFALIFKTNFCNQIDLIDLESFGKTTLEFSVNDLTHLCGCCKIAQNKYFVYGGLGSSNSSSTKIIDIESKSIESLPSDTMMYRVGLCLFNQEVYCFGGSNVNPLNACKKFDLIKKVWYKICNFHHTYLKI